MAGNSDLSRLDKSVSELQPDEQRELAARVSERLSKLPPGEGVGRPSFTEFQKMEAEWVARELDEFVKLIQQYRALYLTAVFIAVGWALGQTASAPQQATIESFRNRPDVAAILCVVPLLNVFIVAILLEAYHHLKSLARYRFVLGFTLGDGEPAWRWERWREIPEGSVQSWTGALNGFALLLLLLLTVVALWFPYPAVRNSQTRVLPLLWWFGLLSVAGFVLMVGAVGYRNRGRNAVADPPTTRWVDLWPPGKAATDRIIPAEAETSSPPASTTDKNPTEGRVPPK